MLPHVSLKPGRGRRGPVSVFVCVCVCLTCVCLHVLVRMPSISTKFKRTRFALHSGYSSSLRKARTGVVDTGGFGAGGLSLATVCGLLRAGGTASYYCIKYCMNLLPSSQCNNKCTNNRNRTGSVVRGTKNADLSRPALGLCIVRSRSARGPFFCSRGLPGTRFLRVCGSATTKILHACVCLCVCCVGYPCNLAARAAVCVRVLLVARRRVLHCLQNFHHQLCCVFFFFFFVCLSPFVSSSAPRGRLRTAPPSAWIFIACRSSSCSSLVRGRRACALINFFRNLTTMLAYQEYAHLMPCRKHMQQLLHDLYISKHHTESLGAAGLASFSRTNEDCRCALQTACAEG